MPLDPQIGLRGAGRSPRHGGDGRGDPDELLGCRRGSQIAQNYAGLLDGAILVPALSSGALPDETTALVREALLLSPTLLTWLAAQGTPGGPAPGPAPGPVPRPRRWPGWAPNWPCVSTRPAAIWARPLPALPSAAATWIRSARPRWSCCAAIAC